MFSYPISNVESVMYISIYIILVIIIKNLIKVKGYFSFIELRQY